MRNFSARETEWLQELDGIELAGFWWRAFAFSIDWIIVGILMTPTSWKTSRKPRLNSGKWAFGQQ